MSPAPTAERALGPEPVARVALAAFIFLLASGPLIRGGNRHLAMIVLEAAALVCVASLFVGSSPRGTRAGGREILLAVILLSPVWLAVVYLVPVPPGAWDRMPGRDIYRALLQNARIPADQWLSISLVPDATRASLFAGLPIAAGFVVGYRASLRQLKILLGVLVALAFAEIVMGLLQIGSPAGSFLYFGLPPGRAVGTFANPNHLANFIAMAIPAYVWLAWMRLRQGRSPLAPHERIRARVAYGAGVVLLLVGLLMSRSRGAALGGLPASLAAIALGFGLGAGSRPWRISMLVLATLSAPVSLVGLHTVVARFELVGLANDAALRTTLAVRTMQGAAQFWPWGAGWGTYAAVFPRFQPSAVTGIAEYAHHDYAQLLFEGGFFAALLMAVFTWLSATRGWDLAARAARERRLRREEMAAALCGLALLGFLLHSLVEFNMRIPANALTAALLAGIYLRPLEPARWRRRASA